MSYMLMGYFDEFGGWVDDQRRCEKMYDVWANVPDWDTIGVVNKGARQYVMRFHDTDRVAQGVKRYVTLHRCSRVDDAKAYALARYTMEGQTG